VKVALIQALNSTNYQKTKASISQLIGHKNHHLEIAAAKYFANFSTNSDLILIDSLYRKCSHWQAANQMVLAQLKHLNKSSVANSLVLKSVDKAPNKWAKGELYGIMGQNHGLLDSLINLYFTETDATAKTLCLESVCRATENFEDEILAAPKGSQKMTHLIKIATDALSANDGYRVYTAAMHLQQKAFKMAGNAKMVQKLDSLLKKWPIPLYYETHLELAKLKQLCKVGQINLKTLPIAYNNPTDWQFAKSIKKNQLLNISTQKGDILIQLDVENAPSTVAYICKLANDGFYDNLIWHRVVSNFVIQGGDPFGNGTGSAKGTLRSEHSLNEYTEGAMGIASAGKDTESCQFFITHNYTPHLNGRYTIIGYVLNGIDVVHKIDVNDKTLSVKLID
ncbi:MAG: peptidylprolyl isomerase, partial [Bacteroidia bacterium]